MHPVHLAVVGEQLIGRLAVVLLPCLRWFAALTRLRRFLGVKFGQQTRCIQAYQNLRKNLPQSDQTEEGFS